MFRNSHNSRGSSTQAGNQPRRWRTVFLALVLALSIGNTGQTPRVQAARISNIFSFDIKVSAPKTTLCTGETAHYTATVYRSYKSMPPGWQRAELPKPIEISGVNVKAHATPFLGTFGGANDTGVVSQKTGFNLDVPYNVDFEFTAGEKPGSGLLSFVGSIKGYGDGSVSTLVDVDVIACKYEVSTNSVWVYATPYGTTIFIEFMKTLMTGGEGGSFNTSGSPTVLWIGTQFIPNYSSTVTINKGSAALRGQTAGQDPDGNGRLLLYLTFNPVEGNDKNCGLAGCGGGAFTLTAEPVVIPVPQAGGSGTRSHTLIATGNGQSASNGFTTANVKPLDASK